MIEGRLVRLRAFEQSDLDANHAFVNDYATLRDMLAGMPLPASYEDERRWLDQQSSYTRGEYQFAVEDGGGDLVGRCGLTRVDWKNRLGGDWHDDWRALSRAGVWHGSPGTFVRLRLFRDESA